MINPRLLYLIVLLSTGICSFAQKTSFQSTYLQEAALRLNLEMLDSIQIGEQAVIDYKGSKLVVVKNEQNVITHIGSHLFATVLRKDHPSPIYNYIEYAMLDNKFHLSENPFLYKDLKFTEGGWSDLEEVSENTAFEVSVFNNKLYVVRWQLDNDKSIELMFPINYERLSMTNRKELEQNIIRDAQNFKSRTFMLPKIDINELDQLDDYVWLKEGASYLTPDINNNQYYSIDSVGIHYLCDSNYPVETLYNLCVAADKMNSTCKIDITFVKYDYVQESITMDMKDFVSYMRLDGCTPYFGIEKNEDGVVEGSLFFSNVEKGYDHVLKIETNIQQLTCMPMHIKATAYLLSPTSNLKNVNCHYNSYNSNTLK